MDEGESRFRVARLILALRQSGVMDQRIMEAQEKTPREPFVPKAFEDAAWDDLELPIDCGQTLTRPVMVGICAQALDAKRDQTVLEIGTGSGYSAAVLSRLSRRVYTIDRFRTLADKARTTLDTLGFGRVETRLADGLLGWPEAAPFDRIVLTGSVSAFPGALADQLAVGGVAVAPLDRDGKQSLVRIEKGEDGALREQLVMAGTKFPALTPGVARHL